MRNVRAFTLLETVIVLAIMTMFFAVSVPLFSKFTEKAKLDTTARSIVSVLRLARTYAITNNANYYVKFDVDPLNKYYIYYKPLGVTTIVDKEYKLPAGIRFDGASSIGFTADGGDTACFKPTGELDETTNDTTVIITDAEDNTKTISVEKTTGRARIE